MMEKLHVYLKDLENRIDERDEKRLLCDWKDFADLNCRTDIFDPHRNFESQPSIIWPDININDAIKNDELMLIREFKSCSDALKYGYGNLMTVRSNYGVGILPSLFGTEIYEMPYEMNTLPNVLSLKGGNEKIEALIERGIPDFNAGWGGNVMRMGKLIMEIKSKYPKIGKYVRVDHPDCQGPMDVCELLWGSDIFVQLVYDTELVHKLLRLVTDTYIAFMGKWFEIVPNTDDYHCFFGALHKGNIMIRDDSAMNLSPKMFSEFIYDYNQELFNKLGGEADHYCGRGDHFVPILLNMDNLYGLHLSQYDYNDMRVILDCAKEHQIPIIMLNESAIRLKELEGYKYEGLVHAVSFA